MLNEFAEVNEYMYAPVEGQPHSGRIKRTIFLWNNDFLGLERILTMIARYFIFHDRADVTEGRMRAEAALRMWCGMSHQEKGESRLAEQYEYIEENYPWLEYWIIDYLRNSVSSDSEEAMDNVETAIEELQAKRKQFEFSSLNKRPLTSDYKTIRYDKIIANAVSAYGPLKMRYLVCLEPEWDRDVHRNQDAKLTSAQEDRVLKTIAAYLLESGRKLRHDDAPRFERTNLKDVAYWATGDTRLDRTHYKPLGIGDRPLFIFEKGVSGNVSKIKPDPEWFGRCGWQLVECTDNDDALDRLLDNYPDAVFFSDAGSCVPLNANERYSRL